MLILNCHAISCPILQNATLRDPGRYSTTEVLPFTFGTTRRPKLMIRSLPNLTGPLGHGLDLAGDIVRLMFCDVRRDDRLQMPEALLGGVPRVVTTLNIAASVKGLRRHA